MEDKSQAFSTPIPAGLIRILLKIESIVCEVENDAPDFIDPKNDTPKFKVNPVAEVSELTDIFKENYELELNNRQTEDKRMVWNLKQGGIWFDIEMDEVRKVWLSDFSFYIESAKPRYLAYYLKDVVHNIEWLQKDEKTGEIRSLSNFKKKFTPPPISEKSTYSGSEILKCADMLARAIKKIDIRTGSALVKFNTEMGRLEPLLKGLSEKLGYKIAALDNETIMKQDEKGESVSHSISLK
ncbi:MAG: hypothetical protein WD022_02810 [Balneolaceae bacterium]